MLIKQEQLLTKLEQQRKTQNQLLKSKQAECDDLRDKLNSMKEDMMLSSLVHTEELQKMSQGMEALREELLEEKRRSEGLVDDKREAVEELENYMVSFTYSMHVCISCSHCLAG